MQRNHEPKFRARRHYEQRAEWEDTERLGVTEEAGNRGRTSRRIVVLFLFKTYRFWGNGGASTHTDLKPRGSMEIWFVGGGCGAATTTTPTYLVELEDRA